MNLHITIKNNISIATGESHTFNDVTTGFLIIGDSGNGIKGCVFADELYIHKIAGSYVGKESTDPLQVTKDSNRKVVMKNNFERNIIITVVYFPI